MGFPENRRTVERPRAALKLVAMTFLAPGSLPEDSLRRT